MIKRLAFVLFLCLLCRVQGASLKIGVLAGPAAFTNLNASFYHLADRWIKTHNILPSVDLELIYMNTLNDESMATIYAVDIVRDHGVNGVIGGSTSAQSQDMQIVLRYYQVPQISDWSTSSALSNKNTYPYFLRTVPPDQLQAKAVLDIVLKFGWKNVIFCYTSDDYGTGGRDVFLQGASREGITVFPISLTVGNTNFTTEANSAKKTNIRITIMFASSLEGSYYMESASEANLIGSAYSYIVTDDLTNKLMKRLISSTTAPYFDGAIGLRPREGIGRLHDDVLDFAESIFSPSEMANLNQLTWYSFDCVYVFAKAAANLLEAGVPLASIKGQTYLTALRNLTTLGTTGVISFDSNGDRLGYYDILNFVGNDNIIAGIYNPENETIEQLVDNFKFFGGSTVIPLDIPRSCPCVHGNCSVNDTCVCFNGWSGDMCDTYTIESTDKKVIIAIVVPVAAAVILVSILVYCVYQRNRRRLVKHVELNQRSKINREELQLLSQIGRGAMGDVFRATLRGSEVAAKRLIANSMSKDAMENYKLESAMMCALRHPNIVLFMGSCHDRTSHEMFLVMEYMTKGSLHDILHNKSVSLSYEMQIHIASQAAQGMNFLHQSSPPIWHRDLKSHNILLDEKWNAKISDFGMTKTKENAKAKASKNNFNGHELGTLYWTAPEVLQGHEYNEKGDVYAFGIILWELFHRQTPYGAKDPMFIALEVMKGGLRPSLDPTIPTDISDLMKRCWSQAPEVRPTFADVVHKLRTMSTASPMYTEGEPSSVEAPTGVVYMVATDIDNTGVLWDETPNEMFDAMELYILLLRELMKKHKGYEVSFRGHSFLVAFANPQNAANWCLDSQLELLNAPWSNALLENKGARKEFGSDGQLLRAGLRVRMALHMGVPDSTLSVETSRVHYFGPLLDKLKLYLSYGSNGEIITSPDVAAKMEFLKDKLVCPIWTAPFSRAGGSSSDMEILLQVVPLPLKERLEESNNLVTSSSMDSFPESSIVDIEEGIHGDMPLYDPSASKFVIPNKDIELGARLGRGHLGESFKSVWSVRSPNSVPLDVAVKVFISQSFDEATMLKLMNNVSHMSKLRHTNIVQVYGAIFEPGHISIVSEFFPRGNLRQLLSENSIQIDSKRKIQILQDIARGMSYLNHQDPKISTHRELKSPKLFIAHDWTIKLSGFGLDMIKDAVRTMTSVGAAPWTAPEVWNDSVIRSYEAVSVYAFGVIMWEVLTRQIPFDKRHPIKLCEAVIAGERPPIPPSCSPSFSNLMQQCWDPSPANRPNFDAILYELSNNVSL